jgi:hypothetical protein
VEAVARRRRCELWKKKGVIVVGLLLADENKRESGEDLFECSSFFRSLLLQHLLMFLATAHIVTPTRKDRPNVRQFVSQKK